jgi:FixJ family two-component response regulator
VIDGEQESREWIAEIVRSRGLSALTFATTEEFLKHGDPRPPDCLIAEVQVLKAGGFELLQKLAAKGIRLPVIAITARVELPLIVRAVKQGAVTVLEKPCRADELSAAIDEALRDNSLTRLQSAEQQDFLQRLQALLPQEREVLDLMVEGRANKLIAKSLNVSVRTVENRRRRVFEKTGSPSLANLIQRMIETRRGSDSGTA